MATRISARSRWRSCRRGRRPDRLACRAAQMERRFIQRRTRSGLAEAKTQGYLGGRPRAMDSEKAALAVKLSDEGEKAVDIAKTLGLSRTHPLQVPRGVLSAMRAAGDALVVFPRCQFRTGNSAAAT
ncbi:helix-turn-helix domain-containing protein [Frondihabitans sp. 762G35]|uniref:helix-turn-helix domain-containing protein n=1 Tax=Frondihabitans sp. 762G35 TaxID=1446794 RepID=UPI000E706AF6